MKDRITMHYCQEVFNVTWITESEKKSEDQVAGSSPVIYVALIKTLGNSVILLLFIIDSFQNVKYIMWRVLFEKIKINKNRQIAAGILPKLMVMVQNP